MSEEQTRSLPTLDQLLEDNSESANERTLLSNVGESLSNAMSGIPTPKGEFLENATQGFLESASFGFADGHKLGLDADKTSLGYMAGTIGGYLVPYGGAVAGGTKLLKGIGKVVNTSKGASALGKGIGAEKGITQIIEKQLKVTGTKITRDGKQINANTFVKEVVEQGDLLKGIRNFGGAGPSYRGGKLGPNQVERIMEEGVGTYLNKVGKKFGYTFGRAGTKKGKPTNTAVDKINSQVKKYWKDIGGKPINTLPDLLTEFSPASKLLGYKKRSKVDSYFGYAAEDALAYAMVEGMWMGAREYRNEEQIVGPAQFITEMALFGPLAATTRFMKGGAPKSLINITNSETRNTIKGLIRGTKNYYKNTNVLGEAADEARKDVASAYNLYVKMNQPGVSNAMVEASSKLPKKYDDILKGKKYPHELQRLIKEGTLEQKEAAAEYMKLSLNGVGEEVYKLRKDFGKLLVDDFFGTKKRQLAGAGLLTLAGATPYFFGNSLGPEQMLMTGTMGYFLFKRGHRMTYRGSELSSGASPWTTGSSGWDVKLGDRQVRLEEQVKLLDMMGVTLEDPAYFAIRQALINNSFNGTPETMRMMNVDNADETTLKIKSLLESGYLKEKEAKVKVTKKDEQAIAKMDDYDDLKNIYEKFSFLADNYSYVDKNSTFKKFDELNLDEVNAFKQTMLDNEIRLDNEIDLLPFMMKPILSTQNKLIADLTDRIIGIYNILGGKEIDSTGSSKYMNVTGTNKLGKRKAELQRIEKGDIEFDSAEDAGLFKEFLDAVNYVQKFGDGRIEIPAQTKRNQESAIKINESDVTDKASLINDIKDLLGEASELFTNNGNVNPQKVSFQNNALWQHGEVIQALQQGESISKFIDDIISPSARVVDDVDKEIKKLIVKIFSDEGAYRYKDSHFNYKNLSEKNQRFIKSIAPLFRKYSGDDYEFDKGGKPLADIQGDITSLRQLMEENGYTIFKNDNRNIDYFAQIASDVDWKREFIKRVKLDADGNVSSYTNTDRLVLQYFEEAGLLSGRNNNTIIDDIRVLMDIELPNKVDNFLDFINSYKDKDKDIIEKFVNVIKSKSDTIDAAAKDTYDIIKALQEEIEPYMLKTVNNVEVGHLISSKAKGKKAAYFTDANQIEVLIDNIQSAKKERHSNELAMFDKSLRSQIRIDETNKNKLIAQIYDDMANNSEKFPHYYIQLNAIGFLSKTKKLLSHEDVGLTRTEYAKKINEIMEDARTKFNDEFVAQDKSESILDFDAQHSREIDEPVVTIAQLVHKYPGLKSGKSSKFKDQTETYGPNYVFQLEQEYLKIKRDKDIKNKKGVFLQRVKQSIMDSTTNVDESVLNHELMAIAGNLDNSIRLKRLTFDDTTGISIEEELSYLQNPLLRGIATVFSDGITGRGKLDTRIKIMSNTGFSSGLWKQTETLENRTFFNKLIRELTSDDYISIDGKVQKRADVDLDRLGDSVNPYQAIPVRINNKTVVSIELNQETLDIIANKYVKWLDDNNLSVGNLEDNGIKSRKNSSGYQFDIDSYRRKDVDNSLDGERMSEFLEIVMRDLIYGQDAFKGGFGKKTWKKLRQADEETQFKSLKRFKLHDNKSAKNITNESLEGIAQFIKTSKDKELKPLADTIDKIIKKKFKYVILEDELPDGSINPLFSQKERTRKKYEKKYSVDITSETMPKGLTEHQQRLWKAGREEFLVLEKKDVSIADAATFLPEEIHTLQSALLGVPISKANEVSGTKFIGHRAMDDGEIGLMKTAGLRNSVSDNIPEQMSSKQDIIFVTKSAYKDLVKTSDGLSMSDEVNNKIFRPEKVEDFDKLQDSNYIDFRMDDISLLSVKGSKEGKLPPNLTGFFQFMPDGRTIVDDFVNFNYNRHLRNNKIKDSITDFSDLANVNFSIAKFRELAQKNAQKVNIEIDVQDTQPGVLLQMADAGTSPLVFFDRYFDMFADESFNGAKIDFSNDAVIQPDMNGNLSSMIADKNGVIDFSETIESYVAGQRRLRREDKENIAFIIKTNDGADELVHISELKNYKSKNKSINNELKKISDLNKKKVVKQLNTLEDWVNYVKDFDNIQIAAMSYRNPITKSNSIIIEGIKSIGAKSEGNKKVVASGDVIHQLKGDYDIDDVISLFSQPASVWKGVQGLLGKHIYTPTSTKNPDSFSGFSLTDPGAWKSKMDELVPFNNLKGAIMNLPEILRFISSNNSFVPANKEGNINTGGLIIQTGKNRYIKYNNELSQTELMAEIDKLNQLALDAEGNPINTSELSSKDNILNRLFFGNGDNSIFKLVTAEDKPVGQFNNTDKFVTREYIKIFEKYLRNLGGDFSTGKKRSVRPSQKARVVEEYARDLILARKQIRDKYKFIFPEKLDERDFKDFNENFSFNNHNIESNLFLKLKNSSSDDYLKGAMLEGVSPRDMEAIRIHGLYRKQFSYGNLDPSERVTFNEEFTTIAYDFMQNQKQSVNKIIDDIADAPDASQKLKLLDRQYQEDLKILDELKTSKENVDANLVKYYQKRVDNFGENYKILKGKLGKKFIQKERNLVKERLIKKEIYKNYTLKNIEPNEKQLKQIDTKVESMMSQGTIEPQRYQETLQEQVGRHVTGVLEQRVASTGKILSNFADKQLDIIIKSYTSDFNALVKGQSKKYALQDFNRLQLDYEMKLVDFIQANNLADNMDAVLAKIMSPSVDVKGVSFVEFNGQLLFSSGDKSLQKRITLAMKFNNTTRVELFGQAEQSKALNKIFAQTSRDVVDILSGNRPSLNSIINDVNIKMDSAAYKNFIYSKNSHNSSILDFTGPIQQAIDNSGMSTLSFYEQFYISIGTDMYRQNVRKGGPGSDILLAHHFEGNGDHRVSTVGELLKRIKSGVTVFKSISDDIIPSTDSNRKGYSGMGSFKYRERQKYEKARLACD